MIENKCAIEVKEHALEAISQLTKLLNLIKGRCSDDKYEQLKKGIGISIGEIQMGLLEVVYEEHPDLDDLK